MSAYLIYGTSNNINNECISNIVKNNLNIINYNLGKNDISDILVEAATFSLFNDQKFIIINDSYIFNSGKTDEKQITKLINYLDNPNELSTLIFVTNKKIDERKKIYKYFKKNCHVIINEDLNEETLFKRVKEQFNQKGYKISNFAINYIIKSSLNNYDIICEELKKIFLYKMDDKNITDDDILNLVATSLDDNIFNFTNAVIKKDIKKSFELLEDLKTLKIEILVLIFVLEKQYRLILQSQLLKNVGKTQTEIAKVLKESPNVIWHALQNGYNYNIKELENKIISLSNLDYEIKSGKIEKYIGLSLFLLDI